MAFRLFDLANAMLLIAVALSFFLPLLVQGIDPHIKIEWTGTHLALGKKPGNVDDPNRFLGRDGKPLPKERTLWLVPALGALGALAGLAILLQPDARTSRLAILLAVIPLILVFGWYLAKDFPIESLEKSALAQARSENRGEFDDFFIHKSIWFYAGLGFSLLALALASARKFSPWVSFQRPEASAPPRTPPATPSTTESAGSRPTSESPS